MGLKSLKKFRIFIKWTFAIGGNGNPIAFKPVDYFNYVRMQSGFATNER
jgi:hypothetical protein